MKKILTVKTYLDKRDISSYGKKIRIVESGSNRYLGSWHEHDNAIREVKEVKITSKFLFIYVQSLYGSIFLYVGRGAFLARQAPQFSRRVGLRIFCLFNTGRHFAQKIPENFVQFVQLTSAFTYAIIDLTK